MPLMSIVTSPPLASDSRPSRRLSPAAPLLGEQRVIAEVNSFVDSLAAMPLSSWLDIGRSIAIDRAQISARGSAWEALQDAIADHDLQMAAWLVRDAVETAVFLASHAVRQWSPEDRRFFAAAHGAVESAALALLARPFLELPHFEVLYGCCRSC